jgi:Transglutaminase-like superfamily
MRGLPAAALALGLLGAPARADTARIWLAPGLGAQVLAGDHSGLTVRVAPAVDGVLATISEPVTALGPVPAYPFAGAADCPDLEDLDADGFAELPAELDRLRLHSATVYDVMVGVVTYVSRRVTLDERDDAPQDAHSVLERGRGRCSGRANLAVGLLRVLGVPARVAHGILVSQAGARWHRWGEAWLGPLGWVPFDPGASVGCVRVRYVPVRAAPEIQSAVPAHLLAISEAGFDSLPRRQGLRLRPVEGATLHCTAGAGVPVTLRLTGPDGVSRRVGPARFVSFDGLIPGRYTLTTVGGAPKGTTIALTIPGPADLSITIPQSDGSGR